MRSVSSFVDLNGSLTSSSSAAEWRDGKMMPSRKVPTPPSPPQMILTTAIDLSYPSPIEDFLDKLLGGTKHAVNVDKLIQSARISFCLIESWYRENSYSGGPKVVDLRKKVNAVVQKYLEAIDASVKTAEHGISFADYVVGLCEYLIQHHNIDLSSYIEELRRKAKSAHSDAEDTCERFSTVQQALIQIARQSDDPLPNQGLFPVDSRVPSPQDDHSPTLESIVPAHLLRNITDLVNCVCDQCIWWSRVETLLLGTVQGDIHVLDSTPVNTAQSRWEDVRKTYMDYKTGISTLKDFYPLDIRPSVSWWRRLYYAFTEKYLFLRFNIAKYHHFCH